MAGAASDMSSGAERPGARSPAPFSTKAEHAYGEIRERIVLGRLEAGGALNQETLAVELGVSITPLREALRRLQAEGLVEVMSHRSAVVAPLRLREVRELYQVRLQLDPFAAALAAANAAPAQCDELRALAAARPADTPDDQLALNGRFHGAVVLASGNSVLADTCIGLWDRTNRYRHLLLLDRSRDTEVAEEHVEIADAITRRDPNEAEKLLYTHTKKARAMIEEAAGSQLQ